MAESNDDLTGEIPDTPEELLDAAKTAEQDAKEANTEANAEADAVEESAAETTADASADAEAAPDLQAQLDERTEDLQRITAEYANYRRRTERERKTTVELAKSQVITALLPLLDDLELAEKHGDLNEGPLKVFRDKLVAVLDGFKVEPFGAEGDAFDAERHEAVQDLSSGDEKVIGTVLRRGYTSGERLLRTAMVIIADPAQDEQPAE